MEEIKSKNPVENDKLGKATPTKLEEIIARLNKSQELTIVDKRTEDYSLSELKDGLWIASTELFVAPKKSARNLCALAIFVEKVKKAIETPENGADHKLIAVREIKARVRPREEVGDFSFLTLPSLHYFEPVCSDRVEHHLKFTDMKSAVKFLSSLDGFNRLFSGNEILVRSIDPFPVLKSIIVRIHPDVETAAAAALGKLDTAGRLGEWESEDFRSAFRFE